MNTRFKSIWLDYVICMAAICFMITFFYSAFIIFIDVYVFDNRTPYLTIHSQSLDTNIIAPGQKICLTTVYTKRPGCRGFINYTLREVVSDHQSAYTYNIPEYQGTWPSGAKQKATTCVSIPPAIRLGDYTLGWQATGIKCENSSKMFEAENSRLPVTIQALR